MCLQVALLETNPYLLGLTIVVSIVHSIFEFLAFKNGKSRTSNQVERLETVVHPAHLSHPQISSSGTAGSL